MRRTHHLAVTAVALVAALAAGPSHATAGTSPSGTTGPVTARFASYNVHAGAGEDGRFDLDRTAAAIRSLRADVVGLQEADVHWGSRSEWRDTVRELGRRLGLHVGFAPIYDLDPTTPGAPRRQFGVAVLSRHPVTELRNHQITRLSTQDPDPVPAPAPGFLEATVSLHGTPVHVYVTHLDYRADPSVRTAQVADTVRILAQDPPGAHQVLLGDLNAEPTSPELAPLFDALQDTWSAARVRSGAGPTYPAAVPTVRIDVVAVDPRVRVLRAEVPQRPGPGLSASDHRPVVATVQLPHHRRNR